MKSKPFTVLFVCTGNLCRSPIAEVILRDKLKKRGVSHIVVSSAGVAASRGVPAASMAQVAVAGHGLNLMTHRAQFLTMDLVKKADLILVMEQSHKKEIQDWFHLAKGKVQLLKSYLKEDYVEEVEDPIGKSLDAFEYCYQDLEKEIDRILPDLVRIAETHKSPE